MTLLLSLMKAVLLVAGLGLVLTGAYLILVSPSVAVLIPQIDVHDVFSIGAGPLPTGIAFLVFGVAVLAMTLRWKIERTVIQTADGTRIIREVAHADLPSEFRPPDIQA